MSFIQGTVHAMEVGKGRILARLVPLVIALLVVGGAYDRIVYRGLSDAQSMDNAQLARQIVRGQGFTTKFLRPQALAQLRDYALNRRAPAGASRELFSPDRFPPGRPRTLPDTYNPPGYPYLLAAWFYLIHPQFDQSAAAVNANHFYSGDRWIPLLNQFFMLLTAVLIFALGRRLFDDRIAWIAMIGFLSTDLVWQYTLSALSTSVLMFLVTGALVCVLEIYCVIEGWAEKGDRSFAPSLFWAFTLALLLAAACLTRLHLLVLLVPLLVSSLLMPRAAIGLFAAVALVVLGLVAPWFLHVNSVSGNPLGSNFALLLYGQGDYSGNEIYRSSSTPGYDRLFSDAGKKEIAGFLWHGKQGWNLLGSNPLILFYGASFLHGFKRRRTRLFQGLVAGCAVALVAANNLGSASPDALGPWNTLVVLFPCMVVVGTAFFFILLDRLELQIRLAYHLIVTALVALLIAPLTLAVTTPNHTLYSFPPYVPPLIEGYGQFAAPDEWVTSDMPWATAWYADRASLWLPDSMSDFENLNDHVCPTGILLLTPVTWAQPLSTVLSGEDKEWLPLVAGLRLPADFPLQEHMMVTGDVRYSIWSDRARWQEK